MNREKVVIMGAAGRDFHNFNTVFRDNEKYDVVAFTATQIPDIDGRQYPASLAGKLYPNGIPILPEADLPKIIKEHGVEKVWFSYSDVSHEYIMDKGSWVMSHGPSFGFVGPEATMIESKKPVIAICAVRTGCGKSQTTRRVAEILIGMGKKVVAIRHPMPYGDLEAQKVQRFASIEDLRKHKCTIEEMEEYEPHISNGVIVYAGVDYGAILEEAEKEADFILWDGGNNDLPFYKPDLFITVADPHRPGDEMSYYPGQVNFRMSDVIVINKVDTADYDAIREIRENLAMVNPEAIVVEAASPISVEDGSVIFGKKVLVVEDGPTLTHGEMAYGAGVIAAQRFGATELSDPHDYAVGEIQATFKKYPEVGVLLPAMGYSPKQLEDLEATIKASDAEGVVIGTPIDLRRVINIDLPATRVFYDLQEIGLPHLEDIIKDKFVK